MDFRILRQRQGSWRLSESLALKAVSLLLALILWITILGFKREELRMSVRFIPKIRPSSVITNRPPRSIEFTFFGPRFALKNLEKRELTIEPDLTKNRETTIPISISEDLILDMPKGVRVLRFSPPNLIVKVEEIVELRLKIVAFLRGQPAQGYEVAGVRVSPTMATVTGPRSLLNSLDAIRTNPFDIEGISGTKSGTIPLEVDSSGGYILHREKEAHIKVYVTKMK